MAWKSNCFCGLSIRNLGEKKKQQNTVYPGRQKIKAFAKVGVKLDIQDSIFHKSGNQT